MYIWRKRAHHAWLNRFAETLSERFGNNLALIERPDRKSITVEVSVLGLAQARELLREHGGTTVKLRPDWLKRLSRETKGKPLRIGARLVILRSKPKGVARGRDVDCRRTLIIPAEAAFGTGEHATTAMCLRLLERISRKRDAGWTMLDAGTGTGILAIAGRVLGAGRVIAIDSDPIACKAAARNAHANHVGKIDVRCGDILEQHFERLFDIVTANLFSEILIRAIPSWSRHLRANGHLILSGILRNQEREVRQVLRRNRFELREVRRRGKWVAVLANRGQEQ